MKSCSRWAAAILALLMLAPTGATGEPEKRSALRKPIVIGLHAPLTGPAPIPNLSVTKAADIYWKWLRHRGKTINGRNVKVVLRNDNNNPSNAAKVCRQMVKQDGAFLLAGVLNGPLGSVQADVCARVAEQLGVPYIALGGGTNDVDRLDNYFAISMTFPAQGRLLADYFVEKLKGRSRQNGLVSFNTPHNREAATAFRRRLEKRKSDLDYERLIARTSGATEAQTLATELNTAGIKNVFVFTSPPFFIQLVNAANNQNYHPVWTGIGDPVTNSDDLLGTMCNGSDPFRARFFSPVPAFVDRNEYDKTFDRAMAAIYPSGPKDEVVWRGWSTAKQIARMLRATGAKLTTRRFISRVEAADNLGTGILPRVNFTSKDHFGSSRTHVVVSRCSDERWHTRAKKYY